MLSSSRAAAFIKTATVIAAIFLPTITLLPLGSLWLWERGFLLHWAIFSVALVTAAYFVQRRLLNNPASAARTSTATGPSPTDQIDPGWTPAEQKAWSSVRRIAQNVDTDKLISREAVLALGTETIGAVARALHPEVKEPLWQFTVPEALAIAEQVSRRLGDFTVDHVPLSHRLTVAQVLSLYRWRGAIELGERAYNVWRLVRVINPMTAATNELRERLTQQILQRGRTHMTRLLADAYVNEVGRAAIDLYGGRLHVSARQDHVSTPKAGAADDVEGTRRTEGSLRILIAGQTGSGKSSLISALAGEVTTADDFLPPSPDFTVHELRRSGFPKTELIDTPGLGISSRQKDMLIAMAIDCDLILWLVAAHRADRQIDAQALAALRQAFAENPNRKRPTVLAVLTHIDRLRPVQEWLPPYDLKSPDEPKSVSIRAAIDDVSGDLQIDANEIIPVSLLNGDGIYNVDALWARLVLVLPEAQQAQLVRQIVASKRDWNLRRVWTQAVGAGRIVGRTLLRRRAGPQ